MGTESMQKSLRGETPKEKGLQRHRRRPTAAEEGGPAGHERGVGLEGGRAPLGGIGGGVYGGEISGLKNSCRIGVWGLCGEKIVVLF